MPFRIWIRIRRDSTLNSPICGLRCQWHLWWEVSMSPLTTSGRCQWYRWPLVGEVNATAHQKIPKRISSSIGQLYIFCLKISGRWLVVYMTPLKNGGRCRWHRWPMVGGVNDTADQWWALPMTPPVNIDTATFTRLPSLVKGIYKKHKQASSIYCIYVQHALKIFGQLRIFWSAELLIPLTTKSANS
jgi:hypothetical protein